MTRPSGSGEIVDWDTSYCRLCKRQFKSKRSLWMHLANSNRHKKDHYLYHRTEKNILPIDEHQKRLDNFAKN